MIFFPYFFQDIIPGVEYIPEDNMLLILSSFQSDTRGLSPQRLSVFVDCGRQEVGLRAPVVLRDSSQLLAVRDNIDLVPWPEVKGR